YPLVDEGQAKAWDAKKEALKEAEKQVDKYLAEQGAKLAEKYARDTARYMMATLTGDLTGLDTEILHRWCAYLQTPEEFHPYLKDWFAGPSLEKAEKFQTLMLGILEEKKQLDAENKKTVDAAMKV